MNNILVKASKILPTIYFFYGVHPPVGAVLEIFSVRKGNERMRCESLKWSMGAKLEDLEDVLVIWTGQVNTKNGTKLMELRNKQKYKDSR
jgi:hypothetical protein